jgi:glyoxylase-like metal-dependent hydrolase (beta-lactamase superfamily II)
MSHFNRPPLVEPALVREIAPGVMVVPDQYINLVPNIGIVVGTDAVLVVDSGLGRENGQRVRDFAMEVAGPKPLWFTSTHFHPEHAYFTPERADTRGARHVARMGVDTTAAREPRIAAATPFSDGYPPHTRASTPGYFAPGVTFAHSGPSTPKRVCMDSAKHISKP